MDDVPKGQLPVGFSLEDLNLPGYPNQVIALKWLQYGQARPYADSVYDAELTFTGRNISTGKAEGHFLVVGGNLAAYKVEPLARLLVHDWGDGWSRLEKFEVVAKGDGAYITYRIRVVSPYTG